MTATTSARPAAPPPEGARRAGGPPPTLDPTVVATAVVAVGVVLTTLPLRSIYSDWSWLFASIAATLPYWVVVGALRARSGCRAWHSVVGLLASVLMLFWVFVPNHLALGVIPTSGSFTDIHTLIVGAQHTISDDHTPVQSTRALQMFTATAVVGVSALADVLCIALRRPLLAAAPLLEILAVASATSSQAAQPVWFVAASVGFLLIVLTGTRLQDRDWGASVDGSAGRLGGARRMAIAGIVASLVIPLALPGVSTNLLARATHHSGDGSGSGSGSGGVVLSGLASLRGSLSRSSPVNLFQVTVTGTAKPFYLRQTVLDQFDNTGWTASSTTKDTNLPLDSSGFPSEPGTSGTGFADRFGAQITIDKLRGQTVPLFASPRGFVGEVDGTWDTATGTVATSGLSQSQVYTETVDQPDPSDADLRAAGTYSTTDAAAIKRYLTLPSQPTSVTDLAKRLTTGQDTAYDKAAAISDYFTNGRNGFVYSLNAPAGDGRSALVTFLDKKQGFCQQYAAAAAVLMRLAGLPTRVVVGYTHQDADASGSFTVTTLDAHAWVEVYFNGIGWVPFDPTPLSGADLGRAVPLPWAVHSTQAAGAAEPTDHKTRQSVSTTSAAAASSTAATVTAAGTGGTSVPWRGVGLALLVLLLLAALAAGPRAVRRWRRVRRLRRALSSADPDPLWRELVDTAIDRDALWPANTTVAKVPQWLERHGVDAEHAQAIAVLARRVESARFSASGRSDGLPASEIGAVRDALDSWDGPVRRRYSRFGRWIPRSLLASRANRER